MQQMINNPKEVLEQEMRIEVMFSYLENYQVGVGRLDVGMSASLVYNLPY